MCNLKATAAAAVETTINHAPAAREEEKNFWVAMGSPAWIEAAAKETARVAALKAARKAEIDAEDRLVDNFNIDTATDEEKAKFVEVNIFEGESTDEVSIDEVIFSIENISTRAAAIGANLDKIEVDDYNYKEYFDTLKAAGEEEIIMELTQFNYFGPEASEYLVELIENYEDPYTSPAKFNLSNVVMENVDLGNISLTDTVVEKLSYILDAEGVEELTSSSNFNFTKSNSVDLMEACFGVIVDNFVPSEETDIIIADTLESPEEFGELVARGKIVFTENSTKYILDTRPEFKEFLPESNEGPKKAKIEYLDDKHILGQIDLSALGI